MSKPSYDAVSIVIPAKNESGAIGGLIDELVRVCAGAEIIVVDDGSEDGTGDIAKEKGASVHRIPISRGNGAAVKAGARLASRDILVFMDGDGQHKPHDVVRLLEKYHEGFDLVVGNRDSKSQASLGRLAANRLYNWLAGWMVGMRIRDLTSGFRVVTASKFREFLHLLPNGFSYPTTSTMAFFRAGYSVCYVGITTNPRVGQSHINILKDGARFMLIIFKVATLYSPLKIFLPISTFFLCSGLSYYLYTYMSDGRFTNMGVLLFVTSILVFLIGLVSEQITSLNYKDQ